MLIHIILLAIVVFAAALVQSTSGFGFGIVFMAVIPLFWPYKECIVLSLTTGVFLQLITIIRLHKYIKWRMVIFPAIGAFVGGTIGVHLMINLSTHIIDIVLGVFLWSLALYMIFLSPRVYLKRGVPVELSMGLIGGFMGGMFSVGGPPMVAYYDSVVDDPLTYQSTIQTYFMLTSLNNLFNNFLCGNVSAKMLPPLCITLACCGIGTLIGIKISKRISMQVVRKLAYTVMMCAGTYDLIKAFFL